MVTMSAMAARGRALPRVLLVKSPTHCMLAVVAAVAVQVAQVAVAAEVLAMAERERLIRAEAEAAPVAMVLLVVEKAVPAL